MTLSSFLIILVISCLAEQKNIQPDRRDSQNGIDYTSLGEVKDGKIIVSKDINLKKGVCKLPLNSTLVFSGGIIRNGTLIGDNTKIIGETNIFDCVKIHGVWDVPLISTTLFKDLSYENSLKDVFALSSPMLKNRIIIEKGIYRVSVAKNKDACIQIAANTEVIIDGTIVMCPNNFPRYDIILIKGNNITVSGEGSIIGDRKQHKGTGGEWGMGIRFHEAINSSVNGLTVSNCWGDCVYIGGGSRKITITNCNLFRARRQGISITKADSIFVKRCNISEISGTNPQYAIDIEPNKGDFVDHIYIEDVNVKDCEGGFLVTKNKDNGSTIGNVFFKNCILSAKTKYPMYLRHFNSVNIDNCSILISNSCSAIFIDSGRIAVIKNNSIKIQRSLLDSVELLLRRTVRGTDTNPIRVKRCDHQEIVNNVVTVR